MLIVKTARCNGFRSLIKSIFVWLVILPSSAMAGSISGTVTATDGSSPLEGYWVKAYNYATGLETGDDTAFNGSYDITGLSAGNYRVYVETHGTDYIKEYYNNSYLAGSATPVAVDTSGTVTINFSLEQGMGITGKVTEDPGGSPINGIMLVARDFGTKEWVRWTNSDSSGDYRIQGLPAGSYQVEATGGGYAREIYDDTYFSSQATTVNVSQGLDTTGINFALVQGGGITGTLFESDGSTPITDIQIEVEVLAGDPCGYTEWLTNTANSISDGTYVIQGVPPIDVYVRADETLGGSGSYTSEWWASAGSSWDCGDAEDVKISSGATISGINFQLDAGGTVSGIVKDAGGDPLYNVEVSYENNFHKKYLTVMTGPDGSFSFCNLPPGPTEIYVRPETSLGLVHYIRKYWLQQGQERHLGTIRLTKGALVTGHIQDQDSSDLGETDLTLKGDYSISWGETLADGSYAFRVPIGYSAINMDDDGYHMLQEMLHITSVNQTIDRGTSTAYDNASCSTVSGVITENKPHNGQFVVLAFPDEIQFDEKKWKGVDPISFAIPSGGSYTLYIPPGGDVTVICGLMSEDAYGQESLTIVDLTGDVSPGATGVDFSYNSEGVTVQGYIKDKTGYLFNAKAFLVQPGAGDDEFKGFAQTDQNGKFLFYNIQPGTYRIDALYYDEMNGKSGTFDVVASPITVLDITVRSLQPITPLLELLLLND